MGRRVEMVFPLPPIHVLLREGKRFNGREFFEIHQEGLLCFGSGTNVCLPGSLRVGQNDEGNRHTGGSDESGRSSGVARLSGGTGRTGGSEGRISPQGGRRRIRRLGKSGWKAYRNRDQHNYFREGAYLTLSQMIYDGGMTRSQAKKFGYAKNAKYYDLLSSIEKVALLAFRSHDDVNRYREMIRLAQLNLKRHEEIMKKVEARSRAGIDSSADIDIVTGRIALARVNLITEEGNLHDASTQYFRTVGVMPDETLQPGELAAFSLPELSLIHI